MTARGPYYEMSRKNRLIGDDPKTENEAQTAIGSVASDLLMGTREAELLPEFARIIEAAAKYRREYTGDPNTLTTQEDWEPDNEDPTNLFQYRHLIKDWPHDDAALIRQVNKSREEIGEGPLSQEQIGALTDF